MKTQRLEATDGAPPLSTLLATLRGASGLQQKRDIQIPASYFPSPSRNENVAIAGREHVDNGDDAAAIPDDSGYLLLAAEGMHPDFVRDDPWFAGYCALMVNVSDIAAMGGRPLAVVDVLFSGREPETHRLLSGLREASEVFGVPVVGGHTGRSSGSSVLSVAILGRATHLLRSSSARAGHQLLYAVDLRGEYRGRHNFNAATHANPAALRNALSLLPQLAEAGQATACKDVSMAGLLGTLAMMCEASGTGAIVDLDRVPKPDGLPWERWLLSFPSYGYLLCVHEMHTAAVSDLFKAQGVACARIGQITKTDSVVVRRGTEQDHFWSLSEGLTGFGSTSAYDSPGQPLHLLR